MENFSFADFFKLKGSMKTDRQCSANPDHISCRLHQIKNKDTVSLEQFDLEFRKLSGHVSLYWCTSRVGGGLAIS
jgi:hypothetical protein